MSWLSNLQSLINDYWQWLIGLAGLSAILSWLPGGGAAIAILTSALQFAASFFQSVSPIINGIFSGIIWIWSNILLPGFLNILGSWPTIFTIIIGGTIGWFIFVSKYEISHYQDQRQLLQCQRILDANKQPAPKKQETDIELPWPFNWK